MQFTGNIVTPETAFHGVLSTDGEIISAIEPRGEVRPEADWIVAGFIDIHLHGLGEFTAETPDGVAGMAAVAPEFGTTAILPTLSCNTEDFILSQLRAIRDLSRSAGPGARIAGAHAEGPWLDPTHCGGMVPGLIRAATITEAEKFLAAADGTLKLLTLAPEREGALEVTKFLRRAGVRVSAGHSGLRPEQYEAAIAAGVRQFCHLFDTYDLPEDHSGVRQPALTDLALCDDRVMKEIIMDGLHVPPELVRLARRAAGASGIVAITDAMQGAGLASGRFQDTGEWYTIRAGELARRERDNMIVGSSLTMNRAFHNMVRRFGFSPTEASLAASANPAAVLGLADRTGMLKPGYAADITVLGPDLLTVKGCRVART